MSNGDLGGRIRHFREAAGLSQRGLADVMQVSQPAVSSWERGESAPLTGKLRDLATALGCSVDDLMADRSAA